MKSLKLFIILIAQCAALVTYGQTKAGKILFGGSSKLNFSTSSSKISSTYLSGDAGNSTLLEFSPQVGYFLIDGLALGISIPISYQRASSSSSLSASATSFAFAPFVRYYFGSGMVKPYVNGSGGLGSVSSTSTGGSYGASSSDSYNFFALNLGGGIGIFVNEHVSFDIALAYAYESYTVSSLKVSANGIGAMAGFMIHL